MGEKILGREFLGFLPLWMLHVSIGMMGSFTTILIHFFEHTYPEMGDYTTILGDNIFFLSINLAKKSTWQIKHNLHLISCNH